MDAWDKNLSPSSKEFGQFPKEIDRDGDGCIYLLLRPDWQGQYSQATFVDGPQHETWRNQFLAGAKAMEIPYRDLQVEMVYPNALG